MHCVTPLGNPAGGEAGYIVPGAVPGQLAVGVGICGTPNVRGPAVQGEGSAASGSEGALCQRGHGAGRRSFRPGRCGCHGAECAVSNVVGGLSGQRSPGRVGAGPGRSRGPEAGGARTQPVSRTQPFSRRGPRGRPTAA